MGERVEVKREEKNQKKIGQDNCIYFIFIIRYEPYDSTVLYLFTYMNGFNQNE